MACSNAKKEFFSLLLRSFLSNFALQNKQPELELCQLEYQFRFRQLKA